MFCHIRLSIKNSAKTIRITLGSKTIVQSRSHAKRTGKVNVIGSAYIEAAQISGLGRAAGLYLVRRVKVADAE